MLEGGGGGRGTGQGRYELRGVYAFGAAHSERVGCCRAMLLRGNRWCLGSRFTVAMKHRPCVDSTPLFQPSQEVNQSMVM